MRKNRKQIRKLGVLMLALLTIFSASAWLFNHDVQTGSNRITVGRTSIIFTDQAHSISLSGNAAIPMTKAYAIENLQAYTFTIENDGDVDLDYVISIDSDNFSNSFNNAKLLLAEVNDNSVSADVTSALTSADIQPVISGRKVARRKDFAAGATQDYALLVYLADNEVLENNYNASSLSFNLIVNAVQAGSPESDLRSVGGTIFYLNSADNGATYTFYDDYGNELSTQTVNGLADAKYYAVEGTASADKFYVVATNGSDSILTAGYQQFGAYQHTIGLDDLSRSGKENTAIALNDPESLVGTNGTTQTIFNWIKTQNESDLNGCNVWYVGNMSELDNLRLS